MIPRFFLMIVCWCCAATLAASEKDLALLLTDLEKTPPKEKPDYSADLRKRRDEFNKQDIATWKSITSLDEWQKHRQRVLASLRKHVVPEFKPQAKVKHLVTGTVPGEGFVIENVVYETIPGLVVTANLYRPEPAVKNPPAILIIHSHHNPKTQGELQDMGMTWARCGCLVLVPDMLGHGERRQHPFKDAASFPEAFKVGRQDYYFRYNTGVQLSLIGETLIGWMARDLMRGVDLVLEKGADPKRIILMGSVAGGGDPAGVTAAADERIACVVPFNFGGPQPETKYPLPEDAETTFSYHGGGGWESTRNMAFSASGGFPHWAVVASVAPRKLIHAHEFSWDQARDPVWKRYQKIWGLFKAEEGIGFAHGTGLLSGKAPEASHCNNIGAVHRKMIYPYLKKWFDIPIPEKEYQNRVPSEKLACMTKEAEKMFAPKSLAELVRDVRHVSKAAPTTGHQVWSVFPHLVEASWPGSVMTDAGHKTFGGVRYQRREHRDKAGLLFATTEELTSVTSKPTGSWALAVAQQGTKGFLKERAATISSLLDKGVTVVIAEVRGTGALGFGGRGRTSATTSFSASELMLGRTMLGLQLRDLRTVVAQLRGENFDVKKCVLWGDSFVAPNEDKAVVDVPHDTDKAPRLAEPNGSLLVQILALMEPEVRGVYARGGIWGFEALAESPFFHVPHDVLLPGVLRVGDLPDVARLLAPRAVKLEGVVDARNRPASEAALKAYAAAHDAYTKVKAADRLQVRAAVSSSGEVAEWIAGVLK